jgi:hypothetical protein
MIISALLLVCLFGNFHELRSSTMREVEHPGNSEAKGTHRDLKQPHRFLTYNPSSKHTT